MGGDELAHFSIIVIWETCDSIITSPEKKSGLYIIEIGKE